MTTLITETFTGSTVPINVHLETTRGPVIEDYLLAMSAFDITLSKTEHTPTDLLNDGSVGAIETALIALIQLAKEGRTDKIDPNDPNSKNMTFYMTTDMVSKFNAIVDSLKAVGVTIDFDAETVSLDQNQLRAWIDYSLLSPAVTKAVSGAVRAGGLANRTLQSMIELEYVRTGNELLSEKLESLEENLTLTKDVLDTLARLQDVHNQVDPDFARVFNFDIKTGGGGFVLETTSLFLGFRLTTTFIGATSDRSVYVRAYLNAASAFFGEPIDATILSGDLFTGNISAMKSQLHAELVNIRALLVEQAANLSAATLAPGQSVDPNSLLGRLREVIEDLDEATIDPTEAFIWLADGFNQSLAPNLPLSDSGKKQQAITFAISAGQALNDKQKEEVRRFLFVFEEYYKSASSLLQKISQIIEKIAQGIARS